jgi:hypothetical protein
MDTHRAAHRAYPEKPICSHQIASYLSGTALAGKPAFSLGNSLTAKPDPLWCAGLKTGLPRLRLRGNFIETELSNGKIKHIAD